MNNSMAKAPRPRIYLSSSVRQTIGIAKKFAEKLSPGSVVALQGDLGSGKTTFIKGLAMGLGLKNPDEVKSPTFAVMHVYETHPPIYHFDLYRLESLKEVLGIGFEDFLNEGTAVSCVEWPERAEKLLPKESFLIRIQPAGKTSRKIYISCPSKKVKKINRCEPEK